jgi:integrase
MSPRSLPFSQWPQPDRDLFESAFRAGDPLEDRGQLAHYRPVSKENLRYNYGCWLGWLTAHEAATLAKDPIARATSDRVVPWIASVAHLHPVSRLSLLERAMRIPRARAPDADWNVSRRLAARLRREVRDHVSHRKTGRIVPTDTLLEAGLTLAAGRTLRNDCSALTRARAVRDGAMIAFLALLPMRRRSLVEMRIGHAIRLDGDAIWIALDRDMTKTGQPWESAVPDILLDPMHRYLAEIRPWLLARGGSRTDVFWVGDRGQPYHPGHLGERITRLTEKHIGVRVSPHLFRDSASTTLARISPDAARLTRGLLGHSGFKTATRHYNHARMIESGRDFAALVDDIREDT